MCSDQKTLNKDSLDPTIYDNWIDFVVTLNKTNWLEVVKSLYEPIDSNRLPHVRFSLRNNNYGVGIRFLASKESELIQKLKKTCMNLCIEFSVNPKQNPGDPLRGLSAWFDSPEKFDMTRELAELWHRLTDAAVFAFKSNLKNSRARMQIVHQFSNMMALKDSTYKSIFDLKSE